MFMVTSTAVCHFTTVAFGFRGTRLDYAIIDKVYEHI
jgi:hypothetical protein